MNDVSNIKFGQYSIKIKNFTLLIIKFKSLNKKKVIVPLYKALECHRKSLKRITDEIIGEERRFSDRWLRRLVEGVANL